MTIKILHDQNPFVRSDGKAPEKNTVTETTVLEDFGCAAQQKHKHNFSDAAALPKLMARNVTPWHVAYSYSRAKPNANVI